MKKPISGRLRTADIIAKDKYSLKPAVASGSEERQHRGGVHAGDCRCRPGSFVCCLRNSHGIIRGKFQLKPIRKTGDTSNRPLHHHRYISGEPLMILVPS